MTRVKLGVLISGRGSNLQALMIAAQAVDCPYAVGLVIANRPAAEGLALAQAANIPAITIDHRSYGEDRESHERHILAALEAADVQLVALAGYMRVLTPFLVEAWSGRMTNIHPSLLPAFPGLDTHRRALEAGVSEHGCTVHLVSPQVDQGEILGQARVPVLPHDDPQSLAARVLVEEHKLYPKCLSELTKILAN